MNEQRFVAEREGRWRELGALLDVVQRRGLQRLPGRDVRRLGALYRAAATDLATARTLGCTDETVRHVNRLCAVAHDVVYSSRRRGPASALVLAIRDEFPRLLRERAGWNLAATGVCLLAGVAAFLAFSEQPELADRTFGPLLRQRAERAAAMPDDARNYVELRGAFAPFFSWGIIANNVSVSLTLFALGAATVGLGALGVIVNGVMVGGAFAIFRDEGVPGVIGTFIAAHGPLELMAIWIAAAAGMRVGAAWMLPGRRTRLASFQASGREALTVLLGTTAMLVVAGIIEGHVSPAAGIPAAVKVAVGALTGGAFVAWAALAGRRVARARS